MSDMSDNQLMYRKMEGEKRIKNILILDRYIEYVRESGFNKVGKSIRKQEPFKELKRYLKKYPFDGGHFKCTTSMYCQLLDDQMFGRFKREYGLSGIVLCEVLALSHRHLQKARLLRRQILKLISISKPKLPKGGA